MKSLIRLLSSVGDPTMRKGELTESEFYTVVRATLAQEEIQHTTVANELAKREKDAEVTQARLQEERAKLKALEKALADELRHSWHGLRSVAMELGDEETEGEPAADHATLEALVEAVRPKSTAEEPHSASPLDFLLQPRGEPTGLALAPFPAGLNEGNKAELVAELVARLQDTKKEIKEGREGLARIRPLLATLRTAKDLSDRKIEQVEQQGFQDLIKMMKGDTPPSCPICMGPVKASIPPARILWPRP